VLKGYEFVVTFLLDDDWASKCWCEVCIGELTVYLHVCGKWSNLQKAAGYRRVATCTGLSVTKTTVNTCLQRDVHWTAVTDRSPL
jgi:hypothetical protein